MLFKLGVTLCYEGYTTADYLMASGMEVLVQSQGSMMLGQVPFQVLQVFLVTHSTGHMVCDRVTSLFDVTFLVISCASLLIHHFTGLRMSKFSLILSQVTVGKMMEAVMVNCRSLDSSVVWHWAMG
jgi:hypothetical protein